MSFLRLSYVLGSKTFLIFTSYSYFPLLFAEDFVLMSCFQVKNGSFPVEMTAKMMLFRVKFFVFSRLFPMFYVLAKFWVQNLLIFRENVAKITVF